MCVDCIRMQVLTCASNSNATLPWPQMTDSKLEEGICTAPVSSWILEHNASRASIDGSHSASCPPYFKMAAFFTSAAVSGTMTVAVQPRN